MAFLVNFTANAEPKTAKPAEVAPAYKIGPGDILEISVWKEDGLQKEVRVRPDGGISFPLVGEIHAGGKSASELQQQLIAKIKRFIPDPSVNVSVVQVVGNHIFVIGKVNRPSDYNPPSYINVMQALTMAGGLNAFAKSGDIKILRQTKNGQIAISFDYEDVVSGDDLKQNIILQNGDVVVVP